MGEVVHRSCPNCGAPVSPQHTLMQCEFCGSPLIVVKPQAPQAPPPPVSPFGAYGGNVMPAPPHYPVAIGGHGRRSSGPVLAIAMAGVLLVGAAGAFVMLGTAPSHPPPSPPTFSPAAPPAAAAGGDPVAEQAKMFEAQCNGGNAQSCLMAGALYEHNDKAKAKALYARACSLGDQGGCHMKDKGL
jgi:hypothetical protein